MGHIVPQRGDCCETYYCRRRDFHTRFERRVPAGFRRPGLRAAQEGDFATALKEWTPLAEQGDAAAQFNLGLMYATGQGVPQDDAEAVHSIGIGTVNGT